MFKGFKVWEVRSRGGGLRETGAGFRDLVLWTARLHMRLQPEDFRSWQDLCARVQPQTGLLLRSSI